MNKKKIIVLIIFAFVAISWIIGIYKLSDMNNSSSNSASSKYIYDIIERTLEFTNKYDITSTNLTKKQIKQASKLLNGPLRKVMHASVYFVLGFIIILMFNLLFDNKRYWTSLLISIILCIFLASFDEYHQTLVVGRSGRVMDVVIDNFGSCIAFLIYTSYYIVYKIGLNKFKKMHIYML